MKLTVPHDACVDSLVLGVHPVDLVDMGVAIASTLEIYIFIILFYYIYYIILLLYSNIKILDLVDVGVAIVSALESVKSQDYVFIYLIMSMFRGQIDAVVGFAETKTLSRPVIPGSI